MSAQVSALWRYPVKSLQGERVPTLALGLAGAEGDRRWAVRCRESGNVLSAKRVERLLEASARTLPGGEVAVTVGLGPEMRCADDRLAGRLGRHLERDVELVPATDPDGFGDWPALVHVLGDRSLDAVEQRFGATAGDVRRFRPNIVLAVDAAFAEDEWVGRRVTIGGAQLVVDMPTDRCVEINKPQPELPRVPTLLKQLGRERRARLGVYFRVERPGTIRLGDAVELADG